MVLGGRTEHGISTHPRIAIRRFVLRHEGLDGLARRGMFPTALVPRLEAMVRCGFTVLVSGPPGAGKTTLLNIVDGNEADRTFGWSQQAWREFTGIDDLGDGLPVMRPGCGSKSVDPDLVDELRARHGGSVLRSRRIDVADAEQLLAGDDPPPMGQQAHDRQRNHRFATA